MAASDREAIRSIEDVIEAMANLRHWLEKREVALRRAISPEAVADDYTRALKSSQMTKYREELHQALTLLDRRRRESRVASFKSALDQGLSINELSRIWGFSRQMASRYAKEAQGEA